MVAVEGSGGVQEGGELSANAIDCQCFRPATLNVPLITFKMACAVWRPLPVEMLNSGMARCQE